MTSTICDLSTVSRSLASFGLPANAMAAVVRMASPYLIVFIFFLGLITGIFPAMRASKIHALEALRYE